MIKKLHKRVSASLPVLLWLMLLTLIPTQLSAFTFTYEGQTLNYEVISYSDKTVRTAKGYYSTWEGRMKPGNAVSGTLVIPSEVSYDNTTYSVVEIGFSSFYGCNLVHVTIPNSVTSIGGSAFEACSALGSIDIPNSVASIGGWAFAACSALGSIDIPNSVTSIDSSAFEACSALRSIDIPNSVTSIGSSAFKACSALRSIDIPYSVTSIGDEAFKDCSQLGSLIIPNSVTSIGDNAFNGCRGMIKSAYPESIGNPFPYNVIAIGYPAEGSCVEDGCIWNDDKTELYFVPDDIKGVFTVPNSVSSIGSRAFYKCDGLNVLNVQAILPPDFNDSFQDYSIEVTVPAGTLNDYLSSEWEKFSNLKDEAGEVATAFSDDVFNYRRISENEVALVKGDYSSMTTMSIPERVVWNDKFYTVTSIGYDVIGNSYGNSTLKSLVLPKKLKIIGANAFRYCSGLTEVKLPETLNIIGSEAFRGCSGLTSIDIPNSVTSIKSGAFRGCGGLTSIKIGNSVTHLGDAAFYYCSELTSIDIPNSVTYIGNSAFGDCQKLTSIDIPNSVTYIGNDAFNYCYGLASIKIGNSVTYIGNDAFNYCTKLTSIDIPNSVAYIGNNAFYDCRRLTSVTIPNSVTTIGDGAFNGCSKLNSFILEDGNKEISIGADILQNTAIANIYIGRNLTGCIGSDVSTVTYGNAVTAISNNAFNGAANLSTVNFGSSIETIGENAFNGCALAELVLPPHVKTIGNNAFAGNSIKNIAIGSEVTEIGEKAFDGANQLNGVSITALTPPNANNNTFSYYDCPLYVTHECVEAYYNFTRCWYRFSGHDLILADKVTIGAASGNVANITLKPGETMKFSATVTPADASLPYIFWRSTNPAFATVDQEGNVTLVDNGGVSAQADDEEAETHTCEIIAETLYADVMASITVMDEAAGVEDIVADGFDAEIARPNDIYTLQGVCLKRDASQSDIDALTPGLYIIAGKKVIVK